MFIATFALVAVAGVHAEAPAANSPTGRGDNYYAAGNRIEITTPMTADVIVAGRQIDIGQPVAGDILAARWRVAVTSRAEDDVRIAAGEVTVDAPVVGDLTLPIVTRGQHALLLLAGVLTLALLRSLLGGLVVFASLLFGLGALILSASQAYKHASLPASA